MMHPIRSTVLCFGVAMGLVLLQGPMASAQSRSKASPKADLGKIVVEVLKGSYQADRKAVDKATRVSGGPKELADWMKSQCVTKLPPNIDPKDPSMRVVLVDGAFGGKLGDVTKVAIVDTRTEEGQGGLGMLAGGNCDGGNKICEGRTNIACTVCPWSGEFAFSAMCADDSCSGCRTPQ